MSPDGGSLASFDAASGRLHIRNLATGQVKTLGLTNLPGGDVQTVRWSHDGHSVLVHQGNQLSRVDLTSASPQHTTPLLEAEVIEKMGQIVDFRILDSGLIVRGNARLLYVRLDGRDINVVDITPDKARVVGASTLSQGRIIMAVVHQGRRRASSELITLTTAHGAQPIVVHQMPFKGGIMNWTPGSERIAYARTDGRIVLELPNHGGSARMTELVVDDTSASYSRVHTLWMSKDNTRLLAATPLHVRMWDATTGESLWKINADDTIRSAHFEHGSNEVIVATNTRVRRITDGAFGVSLIDGRAGRQLNFEGGNGEKWLDDVLPLPGGGLAFALVHESRNGRRRPPRKFPKL